MKPYLNLKVLIPLFAFFACAVAWADNPTPALDIPLDQFLGTLLKAVFAFFQKQPDGSDIGWAAKVAGLVMLVVSIPKVSALRPYWDKIAGGKIWVGPLVAVVGGIGEMLLTKQAITGKALLLFFSAGVGSIALHELCDWLKTIPGINKYVAMAIDLVESILFRPDGGQNLANLGKTQASQ